MNRKQHIDTSEQIKESGNGEYALRRSRRSTVIAALVCLLLAFVVWVVLMGFMDSDYVAVRVQNAPENTVCTPSVELVEVRGALAVLRGTREVEVKLLTDNGDGVYRLADGELELILPEGVTLVSDVDLSVTVRAK